MSTSKNRCWVFDIRAAVDENFDETEGRLYGPGHGRRNKEGTRHMLIT